MYLIKYRGFLVEKPEGGYFFHSMDEVNIRISKNGNPRTDYSVWKVSRVDPE